MSMPRILKFKDAIREAQEIALADPSVFLIGEGVPDPKAIFGTTTGLKEKFPNRVFDMPISENGLTGVTIGAAVSGMKPILVHQRIDFALYSMDQIVNNAAKWFSMYGGQKSVPLVIRLIVGRGWGQGNQHSQNLTSLFAHVPGLKILCPSNAYDAKGLFLTAVKDPNPVLFIEHRWLYETTSDVPEGPYEVPFLPHVQYGNDITVVASGYAMREATKAREYLQEQGIGVDLIDLRSIKPLGIEAIKLSVLKTEELLVIDDAWRFCGLAAEIMAQVFEDPVFDDVVPRVRRLTYPDYPSGSSPALTKNYYNGPYDICKAMVDMGFSKIDLTEIKEYQDSRVHDVPDANFKGPF